MKNWIAQRELLYSLNDSDIRQKLTIRVSEPYLVKEGMVDFKFPEGMSWLYR